MRRLAPFVLALASTVLPTAAHAQNPSEAQQQAVLVQLVNDQLKRIQALEAQVAELQQQMKTLGPQQAPQKPEAIAHTPDEYQPFEHAAGGRPPADVEEGGPAADLPRAQPIDAYGSLRVAAAWDSEGHREIRNNGTRLGLRGEKKLIGEVYAFARVEVGVNLVANDRVIIQGGDPGAPIGQGSQAISSRLGFVGIRTPVGNVAWGKQWSSYYDVAEFTDQFPFFSGQATGAFGAGTDGGIAGTGRAERALQYRGGRGPLSGAIQIQNRSSSPNDKGFVDAWGASTVVEMGAGFAVGAAYNEVRDGVPLPTPNEPQLGDKATIFAVRYRRDRWYAASSYSVLKLHEIDDLGRRYDGNGFELAVRREVTDRLGLEGGYNQLQPDSAHPGDYRLRFGTGNVVYRFGDASRVFFSFKIDGGRRSDGTKTGEHAVATGLNYTF